MREPPTPARRRKALEGMTRRAGLLAGRLACGMLLLLPAAPTVLAQDAASPSPADLAREQEVARRRLENLVQKMRRVRKNLEEEGNTYGAALLERGLDYVESREGDAPPLIDRMGEIVEDLEAARTYQALQKQQAVTEALQALVDILLDREGLSSMDEKLEALANAKRKVGALRDTQEKILRETRERLTGDPETLEELARALGQLEEEQRSLAGDLEASPSDPASVRAGTEALLAAELAAEARASARESMQRAAAALQAAQTNSLEEAVREARDAAAAAVESLEKTPAGEGEATRGEMLREARAALGSLEDAAALLEELSRRPPGESPASTRDAAIEEARRSAETARGRLESADSYAQSEEEGTAQRELAQRASALAEEARRAGVPGEAARSLDDASRDAEQAARAFLRGEASQARPAIRRAAAHLTEARSQMGSPSSAETPVAAAGERAGEPDGERRGEHAGERAEERPAGSSGDAARQRQEALIKRLERMRRETDRPALVGGEEPLRRLRRELKGAGESMRAATRSLGAGLRRRAASQGREAAAGLARAREQLAQRARAAARNREEASETFRKLRLRQEELEKKTRDLARQLESEMGPSSTGSLQRAGSSMEEAGVQMGREEASEAEQAEEEAVRYLDRAREQLDQQEERYHSLRQEELLFRLRDELVDLHRGQKEILAGTVEVDEARQDPSEPPSRSGRRRLEHLAEQEAALGKKLAAMLPKVQAEGAEVYAWLLELTASDMEEISRRLDAPEYRTDLLVQDLIETTMNRLEELIRGLSRELDRRRGASPPAPQAGSQRQGKPPLVPDVAELKVLRYMEEEIYARTVALGEGDLHDELVPSRLQRLAHRQGKITELYKAFKERVLRSQP